MTGEITTSSHPLHSDAEISGDGLYRYSLIRRWSAGPTLRWVMLNPSTADAHVDDPTIRRCTGFARAWGYGEIVVHNLFALRATDPRALRVHADPVGPDNDLYLRRVGSPPVPTVCAWGAHGALHGRDRAVLAVLAESSTQVLCLGTTRAGQPRHPLYVPRTVTPTPMET